MMESARATPTTTLMRREIASSARIGRGVVFSPTVVLEELHKKVTNDVFIYSIFITL